MRLHSITVEGFRAFTEKAELDLDADVIILHGPNGVGKTSLLDAILWVITGRIDRFRHTGGPVSLYAREGIARVALRLEGKDGSVLITRTSDGSKDSLRLCLGDEETDGAAAEARLVEMFLPHLRDRATASSALCNVVTRGVYLQQDLVREFIERDTPAQRFALLSEVIGAGVVIELQQGLERSRVQWARSTTARRAETLQPLEKRQAEIRESLTRLISEDIPAVDARKEAHAIFDRATRLLTSQAISLREPPTSSGQLDRFLKELTAARSQVERELSQASGLRDVTNGLMSATEVLAPPVDDWRKEEADIHLELERINEDVSGAVTELNDLRNAQLAEQDRFSRLATMASAALGELSDVCPVCQQAHDIEKTRTHLQALLDAAPSLARPVQEKEAALVVISERRTGVQRHLEQLRTRIRDAEVEERDRAARLELLHARLSELGIDADHSAPEKLSIRVDRLTSNINELTEIIRSGELLGLTVVRLGEQRRVKELSDEASVLEKQVTDERRHIGQLEATHRLSGELIESLRDASLEVTRKQVAALSPLFQRIYSRIDPHPTFRVTDIITALERGKGLMRVGIADPEYGARADDATPILSSSQLNAFAVSLFLALNLALPSVRLNLTMLDDPLQSLDSINLLGLVDVLRRFRANRQVLVSTHEQRLLGLLQRKLRPVKAGDRMLTITFEGWTREGPLIKSASTLRTEGEQSVLAA